MSTQDLRPLPIVIPRSSTNQGIWDYIEGMRNEFNFKCEGVGMVIIMSLSKANDQHVSSGLRRPYRLQVECKSIEQVNVRNYRYYTSTVSIVLNL